jgi:hypothetical protein
VRGFAITRMDLFEDNNLDDEAMELYSRYKFSARTERLGKTKALASQE